MNQRTVGTSKKTCISLKSLYEKGHQFLANSGTIECTSENGNDSYRLYQDSEAHTLLLCDGDEVEILQELPNSVLVENPESFTKVWFSPEEFEIATFSLTLAKALVFLDNDVRDMGDYYSDVVSYICGEAGLTFNYDGDYNEQATKAYEIIVTEKPSLLLSLLTTLFDKDNLYIGTLEGNLQYNSETVPSMHPTIQALTTVLSYVNEMAKTDASWCELLSIVRKEVKHFKNMDLEAIRTGYLIGNEYFRYLDSTFFGVVINTAFRTGHTCTRNETAALKLQGKYLYCAHAEYNGIDMPYRGFAYYVKRTACGNLVADIFSYGRNSESKIVYKELMATIPISLNSVLTDSKIIAEKINALASKDLKNI